MSEKQALLPTAVSKEPELNVQSETRETCEKPASRSACMLPTRGGNFVDALLSKSWYFRALRFLPALLLTLGLELVNTAVLGRLRAHWLLSMFIACHFSSRGKHWFANVVLCLFGRKRAARAAKTFANIAGKSFREGASC
jgi:hypothetical protein